MVADLVVFVLSLAFAYRLVFTVITLELDAGIDIMFCFDLFYRSFVYLLSNYYSFK